MHNATCQLFLEKFNACSRVRLESFNAYGKGRFQFVFFNITLTHKYGMKYNSRERKIARITRWYLERRAISVFDVEKTLCHSGTSSTCTREINQRI